MAGAGAGAAFAIAFVSGAVFSEAAALAAAGCSVFFANSLSSPAVVGGEIFPSATGRAGAALRAREEGATSRAGSCAADVLAAVAGRAAALEAIGVAVRFRGAGTDGRAVGAAAAETALSAVFVPGAEVATALFASGAETALAGRLAVVLAVAGFRVFTTAPALAAEFLALAAERANDFVAVRAEALADFAFSFDADAALALVFAAVLAVFAADFVTDFAAVLARVAALFVFSAGLTVDLEEAVPLAAAPAFAAAAVFDLRAARVACADFAADVDVRKRAVARAPAPFVLSFFLADGIRGLLLSRPAVETGRILQTPCFAGGWAAGEQVCRTDTLARGASG